VRTWENHLPFQWKPENHKKTLLFYEFPLLLSSMLKSLREKHLKTVMWILTIIIVPTFGLWGAMYYVQGKGTDFVGQIGNHKISQMEFNHYLKMAELNAQMTYGDKMRATITNEMLAQSAWEYTLLIWKADQQKIQVSDEEVAKAVKNMIFGPNRFNQKFYEETLRYRLHLDIPTFESIIRDRLRITKLYQGQVKSQSSDQDVLEAYRIENQKINIAYIIIDPKKIETKIAEKDPKVLKEKSFIKARESAQNLIKQINEKNISDLKTLANNNNLEYKETGLNGFENPIPGLTPDNRMKLELFLMDKGKTLKQPVSDENGVYILQVKDVSPIDQKDLKEKSPVLKESLTKQKQFIDELKFETQLEKEANLQVFNTKKETSDTTTEAPARSSKK
jgi:hypothetical protein